MNGCFTLPRIDRSARIVWTFMDWIKRTLWTVLIARSSPVSFDLTSMTLPKKPRPSTDIISKEAIEKSGL